MGRNCITHHSDIVNYDNSITSYVRKTGIPRQLVSDNGAQFASSEFKEFSEKNGVTHIRTTPYHSKTNGYAERMVQTLKQRFRASSHIKDIQVRLKNFLLSYRNTPHTSTNLSPAEMFI